MLTRAETLSVLLLVVLTALLVSYAIHAWRKTCYTFGQACLYLLNTLITRILWRAEVSGRMPLNRHEGGVIVSNHRSGIDPLLIQLTTDRVVHWMVAREYIDHPSMSWAFKILRSIPVNRRGVDTAAIRAAIRIAKGGGLIGTFPEGRVNLTDSLLLPGRPGAAMIALKARVRVVPCLVIDPPYDGTALGCFLMPARARVVIGEPIDLSEYFGREGDKEVLDILTKRFLSEIARLAGVENFQPQTAGKGWAAHAQVGM